MYGTEHQIELPDGNHLDIIEQGTCDGTPVVYLHGSPGSNKDHNVHETLYQELGIRMIAINRPGIGKSTEQPGWNALSFADDLNYTLDTLDIEKVAVTGFSSGGLHACAYAHQYPDRVSRLGLLGSVAPFDIQELSESRTEASKQLHDTARDNPEALLEQFSEITTPEALLEVIHAITAPADQKIFENPEIAEQIKSAYTDLFPNGLKNVINEIGMINLPWGFDVANIKAETHIWHGTADVNVPVECCEYLAEHIATAEAHRVEGEGHYFPLVQWEKILRTLL